MEVSESFFRALQKRRGQKIPAEESASLFLLRRKEMHYHFLRGNNITARIEEGLFSPTSRALKDVVCEEKV